MEKNYEQKSYFLKDLEEFSKENFVIVEGKKDKEVLESFNIKCFSLKGNIDFFIEKIVEENKDFKKVAILTDYDYRGEKLRKQIKVNFSQLGIEEEKKFRTKIKNIFKINHIENLKL